jgi:hypothetical protein
MALMFGCAKESQKSEVVNSAKLDSTTVSEAITIPNSDSYTTEAKALITRPDLDTAKVDLDSISFISLKEETYEGRFDLYNLDNTFWKSFELNDTCCGPFLNPYSLISDYGHLVLKVVGRTNNAYIIVADEEKHIQKLFKPSDPLFNYFTMGEMISNAALVSFQKGDTATLRSSPSYSGKKLYYDNNSTYEPIKTNGEWLKVRIENGKEGWMRWRNAKGEVLIDYQLFSHGC